MQQTGNYQLNQWELADRILMEDFNGDNEKVDAALAGKLGAAELIREISMDNYDGRLTMDLSDIDWNQWSIMIFDLQPLNNYVGTTDLSFKLGGTLGTGTAGDTSTPITDVTPRTIILFPMRDASRIVRYLEFPCGNVWQYTGRYEQITNIAAITNHSLGLAPGTNIKAYGIR